MNNTIRRWLPLTILISSLLLFFGFGLNRYVSFTALQEHRDLLISWTQEHYYQSVLVFIASYTAAVAISIPGAAVLTLAGGFLFGIIQGTFFVVISATLGATLLFFAIRTSLGDWLSRRASGWMDRMRQGFQHNAFSYLLTLRLIPLFPFWVVNIVPALLDVSAKTFITATFIGIIPGSTVYVMVGNGLNEIFATNQTPDLGIIFKPQVMGPLLALAALSLAPPLYKYISRKRKGR